MLDLVGAVERFRGTTWAELLAFAGAITQQRLALEGRRQRAQRRDGRREDGHEPNALPADSAESPSRVTVRDDQKRRILERVRELPSDYRTAVEGMLAGLSYEQIGDRFGLSPEAVRKRMSRAMQMLASRCRP